jgi:hypothetical protein
VPEVIADVDRRKLVERVAGSRYLAKSARLRDLLIYVSDRVLNESACEIHEQEIGHHVFGRPADYDTGVDNIVRVHASTLRKRLEQYFAEEGAAEPLILEIPKGNYAPVFRKRESLAPPVPEPPPVVAPPIVHHDRRVPVLAAVACLFAVSTAVLLVRAARHPEVGATAAGPVVRAFWSQIFRPGQTTDIVLDDAGVGLYQELTGRSFALSDYFDRSYLRTIPADESANAMVLRRQSSFANISFLWRLVQMAGPAAREATVTFARDYAFRNLKSDNVVLLGSPRSNLWMEPFQSQLGIRWQFDKAQGTYYPVDTWAPGEPKPFPASQGTEARESYCGISLLPNLGGNGHVLIVSATGGSAYNAAAGFLADETAMSNLHRQLSATDTRAFPYFESLIRVKGRSAQPRDAAIVVCRRVRG